MLQVRLKLAVAVAGLGVFAVAAPVPERGTNEALVGRWTMDRAYFGTSRNPATAFTFVSGMDLIYVFSRDGRVELRSEFERSGPVVRRGTYRVAGRRIRHTAAWESQTGPRTMVIETLTADTLRVHEGDMAREFRRIQTTR
jgi:hypothetical protein